MVSLWTVMFLTLALGRGIASTGLSRGSILEMLRSRNPLHLAPGTFNNPVTIKMGIHLMDIVEANQETNEVDLVLWTYYTWKDGRLVFSFYPDQNYSSIGLDLPWKPDIVCYSQTAPVEDIYPGIKGRVFKNGEVVYVPSGKFRVPCDLSNVKTAGGSECTLNFGSWTTSVEEMDLEFSNEPKMNVSGLFSGSKYEVVANTATRKEKAYSCCPEKYVSLEYKLTIKAKEQEEESTVTTAATTNDEQEEYAVSGQERMAAESRLRHDLQLGDERLHVAPREGINQPTMVNMSVTLVSILGADPSLGQLDLLTIVQHRWQDPRLQWQPAAYSGISTITVRPSAVWRPDIVNVEQTDPATMVFPEVEVVLKNDGTVLYIPYIKYRVACELTGLNTKAGTTCKIMFMSWTHNGQDIDLHFVQDGSGFDLSYFNNSTGNFELLDTKTQRNVVQYPCCPEPYVDLTYSLTFRTRHRSSFSIWF